jgi:hypothetical protein
VCLRVFVSLCLCVFVPLRLGVFVSLCLCVCVSLCLCVCVSVCLCVRVSMCLCFYMCSILVHTSAACSKTFIFFAQWSEATNLLRIQQSGNTSHQKWFFHFDVTFFQEEFHVLAHACPTCLHWYSTKPEEMITCDLCGIWTHLDCIPHKSLCKAVYVQSL